MSNICTCDESPLFPRCNKNAEYCDRPKEIEDEIWATQISFEE